MAKFAIIAAYAALFVLTLPALADAPQFVPLTDYVNQPGVAKDPASLSYVANRCSALYSVFAKNLDGETDPERQQFRAKALSAGEQFMGIAAKSMMIGTTIDFGSALARTRNTVLALGELYLERIDRARNLTGNMFSDTLIAGDFAVCKQLLGKT